MRASTGLVYVCACVHECISNYTMSKSHIHYLPQVGTGAYLSSLLALFVSVYWLWSSLASSREGAKGLIHTLRDTFATYGTPDSITSDGGPEFVSHITRAFLKDWNVRHRISSAYHPHANCRAEVGVKSMKRLIAGNTGPGGTLTDSFHKAMLTYRNNPDPETKSSPASHPSSGQG